MTTTRPPEFGSVRTRNPKRRAQAAIRACWAGVVKVVAWAEKSGAKAVTIFQALSPTLTSDAAPQPAARAVLLVTGENNPCTIAGGAIEQQVGIPGLAQQFPKTAVHRRGITATVERPGLIRLGDRVMIEVYEQSVYSPES